MGSDTLKTCRVCKEDKLLSEYYSHKNTRDRLHHECKVCHNKASLMNYFNNKEIKIEKRKDYHFRRNYGITLEEVNKRKEDQDHQCPICMQFKPLVVDHNHRTNKIRGFICNQCNQGLGSFYDNWPSLERAIGYLKESEFN